MTTADRFCFFFGGSGLLVAVEQQANGYRVEQQANGLLVAMNRVRRFAEQHATVCLTVNGLLVAVIRVCGLARCSGATIRC